MSKKDLKIGCIIYSRMKSSRFPGKANHKLCGIPLLERVINKAKLISFNTKIIVATSKDLSDIKICEIAEKNNVMFFRGSHKNVYKRTFDILQKFKFDYFVRICGDRPLFDPFLYDQAIKQTIKTNLDLCTSLNPRILPAGLTVEVISAKSFKSISKDLSSFNKEHITSKYYENPESFDIETLEIPQEINWSKFHNNSYTFDEPQDISFLEYNIKNLKEINSGIEYHLRLKQIAKEWNNVKFRKDKIN